MSELSTRRLMHDITKDLPRLGPEQPEPAVRAIRVERTGLPPLVLTLYPDVEYLFGRSSGSSVVFEDDAVSRQHGRLWCDSLMRWVFRDLSSSNGSMVRRKGAGALVEVKGATPLELRVGDELWLGTERSRVVMLAAAQEARRDESPQSEAARALERAVEIAARHEGAVVLLGPSGSGKTFTARRIHERSGRTGPIVSVNCAGLSTDASALRSELLGHLPGAFTGATSRRIGKLWAADGGTLFLDEVESLPREAQSVLLDVLERTGSFAPLGASGDAQPEPPRFRLISASKVPLLQTSLRRDLVERLLGDAIALPTLDERKEDLPGLVERFLAELRDRQNVDAEVTPEAMALLQGRSWPGQVRELRRVIEVTANRLAAERKARGLDAERLVVSADALAEHLAGQARVLGDEPPTAVAPHPIDAPPTTPQQRRLHPQDITPELARVTLEAHGGNKTHAAQALGVALNTFKKKLKG